MLTLNPVELEGVLDKARQSVSWSDGLDYAMRVALLIGAPVVEQKVRQQVAQELREYASGLAILGQARQYYLKAADLVFFEGEK